MEPERVSNILPAIHTGQKLREEKQRKKKQLPIVKRESTKIPTSMHAMELSLVFNTSLEERKQGWCRRYIKENCYVEAVAPTANAPDQPELMREEDLSTLLGCFLLLEHSRAKPNRYTFETTPYQITKVFRQPTEPGKEFKGGRDYKRLKDSLERLQGNKIATNFWWDTINGERVVKNNFNFVSTVVEGEAKSLRICLNPEIVEGLEKGYLRFLQESDLKDIIKLRGYAKVLALFLLKVVGYKESQDFKLATILRYLGVEDKYNKLPGHRFNFYITKMIVPAVEKAAKSIGFSCTYRKDKKQLHLYRIKKVKQIEIPEQELPRQIEAKESAQEKTEGEKSQDPLLTERRNEAFRRLTDVGVHAEMMNKIFSQFDIEEIERQIEWLPYRKSDNPAGVIVSAIYGRWDMPTGYEQKREEALRSRV